MAWHEFNRSTLKNVILTVLLLPSSALAEFKEITSSTEFINSIHFINLDEVRRTIRSPCNEEFEIMPDYILAGNSEVTIWYPEDWQGAVYAMAPGRLDEDKFVELEVTFQGFNGRTWYDIEHINNKSDQSGIHFAYHEGPRYYPKMAGCDVFPCGGSFDSWDDDHDVEGEPNPKIREAWYGHLICLVGGHGA